jgi:hypothetical protein
MAVGEQLSFRLSGSHLVGIKGKERGPGKGTQLFLNAFSAAGTLKSLSLNGERGLN